MKPAACRRAPNGQVSTEWMTSDLVKINFADNWATGLEHLLKKLEKIHPCQTSLLIVRQTSWEKERFGQPWPKLTTFRRRRSRRTTIVSSWRFRRPARNQLANQRSRRLSLDQWLQRSTSNLRRSNERHTRKVNVEKWWDQAIHLVWQHLKRLVQVQYR